ncbi:MAG: MFS transporter [Planctomycetota bacterium]
MGWVSFLTDVASEMVFPLLPAFIDTTLGAGKLGLGFIEGIAETTASLARLPSGVLSDRMAKRKPLILFGYGLASIVRPLMGLATAGWQALFIRFSDRLGKGIRGAPRDALIADTTDRRMHGRAFGFHRAMDHAGAAVGPILAFLFLSWWPDGIRTLFLCSLIPGLAAVLVILIAVRESSVNPESDSENRDIQKNSPNEAPQRQENKASVWTHDRRFPVLLVALIVFALGNSTDAFLLLRARELGIEARFLPLLWFFFHLGKSTNNLLGGKVSDRMDPRIPLAAGFAVYCVVYVLFGLATSAWQAVTLFLAYSIYFGLAEPAEKTLVAKWVPVELRGTAFGWFNLATGIAMLPASLAFGWIWQYSRFGAMGAFGFGAVLALVAAVLILATYLMPGPQGSKPAN